MSSGIVRTIRNEVGDVLHVVGRILRENINVQLSLNFVGCAYVIRATTWRDVVQGRFEIGVVIVSADKACVGIKSNQGNFDLGGLVEILRTQCLQRVFGDVHARGFAGPRRATAGFRTPGHAAGIVEREHDIKNIFIDLKGFYIFGKRSIRDKEVDEAWTGNFNFFNKVFLE